MLNLGIISLPLRVESHWKDIAKSTSCYRILFKTWKVSCVYFQGLEGAKYYKLTQKYLSKDKYRVISIRVKGGRKSAEEFIKNLKLVIIATHVAEGNSMILHTASSTHRKISDEQLIESVGVSWRY